MSLPAPLHARLTVVRADEAPTDIARRLAFALVGDAVDLRPGPPAPPVVITAADLREDAVRRAGIAFERRAAARDEAVARRTGLAARRTHLLERAEWCETTAGTARAIAAALEEADARLADAQAATEGVAARRDRVAEQRAAARAAVEEARLELEGLDGANLDETGVRRGLEAAGRAEQEAVAALEAADAHLASLHARIVELDGARATLVAARDDLVDRDGTDVHASMEPEVREALAVYDELAARAGIDPGAAALADDLARVDAELGALRLSTPEPPTDAELAGAEADIAAARRQVDAVRAVTSSFDGPPPEWWVELNALHAEVVDTEAAVAGGGLRKNTARRRYEEAVDAERASLDALGFVSYLDALMSGGRLPSQRAADDLVVAEATDRLTAAEDRLEVMRRHLLAGAPVIERISERERLLDVAARILGCDPGDQVLELLSEHPAVPPMVISELAAAMGAVGVSTTGVGIAVAARRWLEQRDASKSLRHVSDIDRELAAVVAERHAVENALGPATAVAERATIEATAAARAVSSLEAELHARAGDVGRLLERAVAARELREQVEAVEAHLARSEAEALEQWAAASDVIADAQDERDRIERDLADLARRASRAAADLPAERRPAFDLVTGLAPLGAALRAEAVAIGVALDVAEAAVAEADAVCGNGPSNPTVADLEAGLRAIVAAAPAGTPLVLAEPLAGLPAGDVEHLLGTLLDALGQGSAVVVTCDLSVVGWAIGLPADVGALVAARSLDPVLARAAGTVHAD